MDTWMSRALIPVGARFRVRPEGSEAGYVTAETALLLPVLLGFGYALTMLVLLAGDQIRCADAAWETARALARGSPSSPLRRRGAGPGGAGAPPIVTTVRSS